MFKWVVFLIELHKLFSIIQLIDYFTFQHNQSEVIKIAKYSINAIH